MLAQSLGTFGTTWLGLAWWGSPGNISQDLEERRLYLVFTLATSKETANQYSPAVCFSTRGYNSLPLHLSIIKPVLWRIMHPRSTCTSPLTFTNFYCQTKRWQTMHNKFISNIFKSEKVTSKCSLLPCEGSNTWTLKSAAQVWRCLMNISSLITCSSLKGCPWISTIKLKGYLSFAITRTKRNLLYAAYISRVNNK